MNSVLFFFVLLLTQIWMAIFCSSAGQLGSGSGWSLFSGPPALWGPKVSTQTGSRTFQKINRDNWLTSLLCCFPVSCPAGTPSNSLSSLSTQGRFCHQPPQQPRREGSPAATRTHRLAARVTVPGIALNRTSPRQSQGEGEGGPVCPAAKGSNTAGQDLRATGGLHCLSPRSSRAGNAGKGASRGGCESLMGCSSKWREEGPAKPPGCPQLMKSRWALGVLCGHLQLLLKLPLHTPPTGISGQLGRRGFYLGAPPPPMEPQVSKALTWPWIQLDSGRALSAPGTIVLLDASASLPHPRPGIPSWVSGSTPYTPLLLRVDATL